MIYFFPYDCFILDVILVDDIDFISYVKPMTCFIQTSFETTKWPRVYVSVNTKI